MVIGVWLKVGGVEWLISIMSVDEHCADGAHTQDCVTQQGVSASSTDLAVFLKEVSVAPLFNLSAHFCMIWFYNHQSQPS